MKEYTIFHDGKLWGEQDVWSAPEIPVGAYVYAQATKYIDAAWYIKSERSTNYRQPEQVPSEYRAMLLLMQ